MIGIGLTGGLGNQLFQYAAARAAAERLNCPLAIVPWQANRETVRLQLCSRQVVAELAKYHPNVVQSRRGATLGVVRGLAGDALYAKLAGRLFPHRYTPPARHHRRNGTD